MHAKQQTNNNNHLKRCHVKPDRIWWTVEKVCARRWINHSLTSFLLYCFWQAREKTVQLYKSSCVKISLNDMC